MTRPSLLCLTHRVPHPPNRGDRIRTFHFLEHLATRTDIWLGCLADEPVSDDTWRTLRTLCRRVAIVRVEPIGRWIRAGLSFVSGNTVTAGAFQSPRLAGFASDWANQTSFDAALCSSSALAPYLNIPQLQSANRCVDLIDVDSQKWVDYAAASTGPRKWLYTVEGKRLQRLESSLAEWTHGITVVSEPEANLYRAFQPDGPVQAIPNGVNVGYFTPGSDPAGIHGCVFVGALDYRPNIDGIVDFARNVWPKIHNSRPDQVLRIVGREPVAVVRQLDELPGVEVVGTVPDVRPYLEQAQVVVVPLHIARGVQNKVLEALAMGKAVVASPEPLVGLNVQHGVSVFQASTADDWVKHILQLFDNQQLRREVGLAGHAYVNAHHRWDQCLAGLMDFLGLRQTPAGARSRSNANGSEIAIT